MQDIFQGLVEEIGGMMLIRLPMERSLPLPSRGMVMGEGHIKQTDYLAPLEPDGKGGHFLVISPELADRAGLKAGDTVPLSLASTDHWPEPELPEDLAKALLESGQMDLWEACTVKARWEWIRWLRNTNNAATRAKRLPVAMDKLKKGLRRPCCFNAAGCTLPQVSKSGVLVDNS